jgi:hypothetical protein
MNPLPRLKQELGYQISRVVRQITRKQTEPLLEVLQSNHGLSNAPMVYFGAQALHSCPAIFEREDCENSYQAQCLSVSILQLRRNMPNVYGGISDTLTPVKINDMI